MSDLGFTHVALAVRNLEASTAFYSKYAGMEVIHRRADTPNSSVAWMTDLTRPFVIVLVQLREVQDKPLGPFGHLGIACKSRADVDRHVAEAKREGRLRDGPTDSGPPVGYWAFIADPDENILEVSYGQEVAFTVESARHLGGRK